MSSSIPSILHTLDTARTQWYHFTTIAVAGMGFFTDAYDLFCIPTVSKLLGRLYYCDNSRAGEPGQLPNEISNLVVGVALIGTIFGILVFGWLGDKLGRKKVYGITLVSMVISSIGSALSLGRTHKSVIGSLCFFRFWLGFFIGGEYPLSATIMAEYSNKKNRGAFIAAVFALQGVGIVFACLVSMLVSLIFLKFYHVQSSNGEHAYCKMPAEADYLWRVVLMLGALPALLTFYWRMKMPETGRFTLINGDGEQAAADMGRVLGMSIDPELEKVLKFKAANSYPLISYKFFHLHGVHLLGTMSAWFCLDLSYYTMNLTQSDVLPAMGFTRLKSSMNAVEEVFETSRAMLWMALLGTFPGYLFAVLLIEKVGRFFIQLVGFFMMSIFMLILGVKYGYFENNKYAFGFIYGLTLFISNAGPNCTTFVLPAELFPTRVRSTCHALSAAAGKMGAMIGLFVVTNYTQNRDVTRIKHAIVFFAFVNMAGLCITFLLPETKGRSLEEISGEDSYSESMDSEVSMSTHTNYVSCEEIQRFT